MSASLEDRLESVEKELAALKRLVEAKTDSSWQSTFGMFADDPEFDEILRRGNEIRARERDDAPES